MITPTLAENITLETVEATVAKLETKILLQKIDISKITSYFNERRDELNGITTMLRDLDGTISIQKNETIKQTKEIKKFDEKIKKFDERIKKLKENIKQQKKEVENTLKNAKKVVKPQKKNSKKILKNQKPVEESKNTSTPEKFSQKNKKPAFFTTIKDFFSTLIKWIKSWFIRS